MRTLILLTALLLLAFQAQAQKLQETADQVPAQDQPGVKDQDLFLDEDQDVAISLTEEERFTRQLIPPVVHNKILQLLLRLLRGIASRAAIQTLVNRCFCRPQHQCPYSKVNKVLERVPWVCRRFGHQYKLCCT